MIVMFKIFIMHMDFKISPWYEDIYEYLKNDTIPRGMQGNENKN